MKYTMTFLLSTHFQHLLLLRKPDNHHNPLFRSRWTTPGGKIEVGETNLEGAIREVYEETKLRIEPHNTRLVLRFPCNCDPTEKEHEVGVYATTLPFTTLIKASGTLEEPLDLFELNDSSFPSWTVWYIQPLLKLSMERLRQPLA